MSVALTELTWEFQAWCQSNRMPEEGDASDLILLPHLTAEQREWLTNFLVKWDNAVSDQEYPDPRAAEDWKRHAE